MSCARATTRTTNGMSRARGLRSSPRATSRLPGLLGEPGGRRDRPQHQRERERRPPRGRRRARRSGRSAAGDRVHHLVDRRRRRSPPWRAGPGRPGRPRARRRAASRLPDVEGRQRTRDQQQPRIRAGCPAVARPTTPPDRAATGRTPRPTRGRGPRPPRGRRPPGRATSRRRAAGGARCAGLVEAEELGAHARRPVVPDGLGRRSVERHPPAVHHEHPVAALRPGRGRG